MSTWHVILLGILEGLTEFIPVSSTGHLVLAGHLLGFDSPGKAFEILIQLGAILAILTVYFGKLWHILTTLPRSRETQRFVGAVLVAFLPAAVIGLVLHKQIKSLLGAPLIVCVTLVVGGFVLLAVDRWKTTPRFTSMTEIPARGRRSWARCSWAATSGRLPNSPSSLRCRPWLAPSRSTS